MSETETYEQSDDQASMSEVEGQRRSHRGEKGGHHKREELTSLTDLQGWMLQGKNEGAPRTVGQSTKTKENIRSTPNFGQSLFD